MKKKRKNDSNDLRVDEIQNLLNECFNLVPKRPELSKLYHMDSEEVLNRARDIVSKLPVVDKYTENYYDTVSDSTDEYEIKRRDTVYIENISTIYQLMEKMQEVEYLAREIKETVDERLSEAKKEKERLKEIGGMA